MFVLPVMVEVIIDYGSKFVTYRNKIESKGVQFPGRKAPDKKIGVANRQSPVIARKSLPLATGTPG